MTDPKTPATGSNGEPEDQEDARTRWEAQINALLDGELDDDSATALKAAAADDRELARAIVDAWQLQKELDELKLEPMPVKVSRRIRQIPRDQKRLARASMTGLAWRQPMPWLATAALAVVVTLALVFGRDTSTGTAADPAPALVQDSAIGSGPADITPEQVDQAREELLVAFAYLDKVGLTTGEQIQEVLRQQVTEPIRKTLDTHIPYTPDSAKEEHA